MCGKESQVFKAIIEGAEMTVCKGCAKYGKVLRVIRPAPKRAKIKQKAMPVRPEKEIIEMIVSNCSSIIKRAREQRTLTQEQVAKMLNEKESLIQKVESGNIKPSIMLARKLERFLRIKLVEQHEETFGKLKGAGGKGDALTIGDLIKVKGGKTVYP